MSYNKIAGIGGIGKGMLFLTDINETLGRSESRLAELSDAKDYCKLHIVFHYIAALLTDRAKVYPIGCVGADAYGTELLNLMRGASMDIAHVTVVDDLPTMIGVCLQYPDKETCNFSASNSACSLVTPEYAIEHLDMIGVDSSTIAAFIPEVSVESRIAALRHCKDKGAFCALTIPESEADAFKSSGIFALCDLLALNENEALKLLPDKSGANDFVDRLYDYLYIQNPKIMLMVTCGKRGAYTAHDGRTEFVPCYPANAVNTTGAGDACLGGTLAGLALGLPFQKGRDDAEYGGSPLSSAVELGVICAGMSVETADTIALHVNAESIGARIIRGGWNGYAIIKKISRRV